MAYAPPIAREEAAAAVEIQMSEEFIEYRVRPVTRFVVTRYDALTSVVPTSVHHGEFDNFETAHAVGYALAKAEHDRLGYPLGDMRIRYPDPTPPGVRTATLRDFGGDGAGVAGLCTGQVGRI